MDGRALLGWTLGAVARADLFDLVVVATRPDRADAVRLLAAAAGLRAHLVLAEGGERRQDSVRNALDEIGVDIEIVVVHDAARPLCPAALFADTVAAARRHGAATAAVPVVDSVKRVDAQGRVTASLDRSELVSVQTPQAFRADLLRAAHERAFLAGVQADDDCALVEWIGEPVATVPGSRANLKVTTPMDMTVLEALVRGAAVS